jgi:hypothetical protein
MESGPAVRRLPQEVDVITIGSLIDQADRIASDGLDGVLTIAVAR